MMARERYFPTPYSEFMRLQATPAQMEEVLGPHPHAPLTTWAMYEKSRLAHMYRDGNELHGRVVISSGDFERLKTRFGLEPLPEPEPEPPRVATRPPARTTRQTRRQPAQSRPSWFPTDVPEPTPEPEPETPTSPPAPPGPRLRHIDLGLPEEPK